ncbi:MULTISPECIES: DUF4252 domain-containing protein [Tenacibaculum]|uniref:DUF4252 domain-containing protein n=1 Tax=Tenacibaculum TaxID=104267 RepID=UPI001F0B0761|nr:MULTISPECIES: DUF4252 domain-containing protein [Tenacibaculum]MCH3882863.1 DUF4252 domain-containing protein [Tenacibaculum aquimarinum]MDO6600428.1 DUF4252 domain-containing protein [Tenacibaculum sp. 1_MG-2023]
MKKIATLTLTLFLFISCGSGKSFQSFFNDHKNDIGVTAFQVPNFMRTLLGSISPEMGGVFDNIQDFKFITFNEIDAAKQGELINQMGLVTTNKYTDILRENKVDKTKILSVVEDGDVVKEAIIFNSTLAKTSVFYLKGSFDPNTLKEISEKDQFDQLSTKLLNQYQSPLTPGFNPNK